MKKSGSGNVRVPPPLAIRHKGFAREEPSLPGHGQAPKLVKGQGGFDLLNACEASGLAPLAPMLKDVSPVSPVSHFGVLAHVPPVP